MTPPQPPAAPQVDLHQVSLFAGLADTDRLALEARCQPITVPAGAVIFTESSLGTELYILTQGRVRVDIQLPGMDPSVPIYEIEGPEVFGEFALVDGLRRSATLTAQTVLHGFVLHQADFVALIEAHPHLSYCVLSNLARLLATKLREMNLEMRNLLAQQRQLSSLVL